jgi:hypothetical protein
MNKLNIAYKKAINMVKKKYPNMIVPKRIRVNPICNETYCWSASDKRFGEIVVSPKRIISLNVSLLTKLLLHEFGHHMFMKGRVYKDKYFIEAFMSGKKEYSLKQNWEDSYPNTNMFVPQIWKRDYIDFLGFWGITIPAYATKHKEEEWSDMFAALVDPEFKIHLGRGKSGIRLMKKLEAVELILSTNKYLKKG